jgi:DNA-3-methyladenine glycosylase II
MGGVNRPEEHLAAVDPRMGALVESHGPCSLRRRRVTDPFAALTRSIVGQRISTKAAATVYERLQERLGGSPTPREVLRRRTATLRRVGLPPKKVQALRELARRVHDGRLPLDRMGRWSNEAIQSALIEVPGIGPWTAQMFTMFHLARPDVFPSTDLGILQGMRLLDGLKARPSPREASARAEVWAPYRSTACWYLWRLLEGPGGI